MTNGIYKLTTKMRYLGQQLVNSFWYRSVLEGTFVSDLLIDGASALAKSFIEGPWEDHWRQWVPTNCYFDGVVVTGYNDMFELLYNNPIFVQPDPSINAGTAIAGDDWMPPSNVANCAFYLKNRLVTNPLFPAPKKGLVAISPIKESHVGADGTLNEGGMSIYQPLAASFAEALPWGFATIDMPFTSWEIGVGLPNAFVPLRARTWKFDVPVLWKSVNVLKAIEVADVETCVARKLLGYRRTRKVEG